MSRTRIYLSLVLIMGLMPFLGCTATTGVGDSDNSGLTNANDAGDNDSPSAPDSNNENESDHVQMMTLHAAKGLEFNNVFIDIFLFTVNHLNVGSNQTFKTVLNSKHLMPFIDPQSYRRPNSSIHPRCGRT